MEKCQQKVWFVIHNLKFNIRKYTINALNPFVRKNSCRSLILYIRLRLEISECVFWKKGQKGVEYMVQKGDRYKSARLAFNTVVLILIDQC